MCCWASSGCERGLDMGFLRFLKKGGFLLLLLLLFAAGDLLLWRSGWVQSSGYFWLDDFEITRKHHPEEVWEGVVFGSSELISGYREDLSNTNYVNLGMDYGTMEDLEQLLEKGLISVSGELILALNWSALCDDLDTNPTYIWHKGALEPYCYFQRARLSAFLLDEFSALLGDGEPRQRLFLEQDKEFYHGHMTPEELSARVEKLTDLYLWRGDSAFDGNLAALGRVLDWCREKGLSVRCLWMPENPLVSLGAVNDRLREDAGAVCAAAGVAFTDMTDVLPADCFYDTGHMDYETGAPVFTEVLEAWISSKKA